ncbi:hypothetical protein MMC13_004109 [Lambiella insularis]|nr:hypothetical protein [Lambiella insularis]
MPPIAPDRSGGDHWELEQQPPTNATAQESPPASFHYPNVHYIGDGVWPDQSHPDVQYQLNNSADDFQGQHWRDLPTPSHDQAHPEPVTLYNNLESGDTAGGRQELIYGPEAVIGQAEGRQSVGQDFHVPFSISVPSEATALSRANSDSSYAPQPIEAHDLSAPTGQAHEQPVSTNKTPIQAGSGSSASRPQAASTRKQGSSMTPAPQVRARRSEEGHSLQQGRRASPDYARADVNKASSNDDNAKGGYRVRNRLTSSFIVGENGGVGMKRTILRKNQLDAMDLSILPAEKGFPIQVGSQLFRLSGASIMSDAPSYFSTFFEDQLRHNDDGTGGVKTLFIDRDPNTFSDVSSHLQGYHVCPRDGEHFVRLFADAQFYYLPQLLKQLHDSEIFIQIGEANFQIPRNLFSSPGDSPNFFSLGFAAFINTPEEVFPGLERSGLLRPPSISPPSVQNRSAQTFSELLHLLRGYPLHIKNNEHRSELLRDCRYFHLRGLEQKLIRHHISYNVERQKSEIILRLEDIRQSGISFVGDASPSDRSPLCGWVNYMRPFVDESSYELIVEIGDESLKIDFRSMRGDFHGDAKARITSLFQVVANKMNLPTNIPLGLMLPLGGVAAQPVSPGNTPLSEDKVKVCIERDAHVLLDGDEYALDRAGFDAYDMQDALADTSASLSVPSPAGPQSASLWWQGESSASLLPSLPSSTKPPARKRKRKGSLDEFGEWIIRKGQWRLRVQPRPEQGGHEEQRMEIVLHAVKLDALSGQKGRNMLRGFLS